VPDRFTQKDSLNVELSFAERETAPTRGRQEGNKEGEEVTAEEIKGRGKKRDIIPAEVAGSPGGNTNALGRHVVGELPLIKERKVIDDLQRRVSGGERTAA